MKRRPKKTRLLTLVVKVRADATFSAAAVRREVRCLINDACNYAADPGDVRAVRVSAAPRP